MDRITPAIQIDDLAFHYPEQEGLFTQFNLRVEAGDRFGLFGPNGAGKTTLMNLMTGLLVASSGKIRLFGKDMQRHHRRINKLFGFVPQDFAFYQELSPVENLEFFGAWSGMNATAIHRRTRELLELLGLTAVRNKKVQQFSGGMKRRVNLAIGVIHKPRLLFLDEPTVGVDVQTRHAIINYLKQLNESGTTLIYTSHQLSEAEELCNTIAMIDEGRIIAHETLDSLLSKHRQEGLEGLFLELTGKHYRDHSV
ncbi:MAG TPA: ABC transporter ATP-binding protein [Puia sp.]|jgi:ABC-2 type transport system ATP-binding protein|nr:ABC transporter ATP-binding protein [Puia sp.]